MEKNLEGSKIIINGENLLDKFENECKEIVEKYGDKAKGYEIADKIALPNGSCLYRITTFVN